jgi:hypothetical protein
MELIGITFVVGVACLAIAGIVALAQPFERWKSVAVRFTVLGGVLALGSLVVGALTAGPAGLTGL